MKKFYLLGIARISRRKEALFVVRFRRRDCNSEIKRDFSAIRKGGHTGISRRRSMSVYDGRRPLTMQSDVMDRWMVESSRRFVERGKSKRVW